MTVKNNKKAPEIVLTNHEVTFQEIVIKQSVGFILH